MVTLRVDSSQVDIPGDYSGKQLEETKNALVSDHTCLLEDLAIIAIAASVFASCFLFMSVLDYQVGTKQRIFLLIICNNDVRRECPLCFSLNFSLQSTTGQ